MHSGRAGDFDPQSLAAIAALRERFPHTPFLTLGQTVFWDEPIKAAFVRLLRAAEAENPQLSGGKMVAGVHDTDYFAKLAGLAVRDTPFVLLRHNDGDTRGLWSAAGEISAVFGAEVVPSRGELTRHGVAFGKAAQAYPGGAEALLNQETEAPLWRAIVHTEPHQLLAAEVRLGDIAPALIQQIRWAFRRSLRSIGCPEDFESNEPCASREVARKIMAWVENYLVDHPEQTLSDLYRYLIPRIWELTAGPESVPDLTTTSVELFRFNGVTARLPRFRFVDIFLNPATREFAKRCYDQAVAGSGIYALDQFGPGALPFDVVIPGRGRGTLCVDNGRLVIQTEDPIELCDDCDPDSVSALAGILHRTFGEDVMLVGKAVSLISMLSAEYIFVFHEKASGYTARTRQLNEALRAGGIDLKLHPMVRVKHAAWDAVDALPGTFSPPGHMARAFGQEGITPTDFAEQWRSVQKAQDEKLEELRNCSKTRDLLRYLTEQQGGSWTEKEQAYLAALDIIQEVQKAAEPLREDIRELKAKVAGSIHRALEVETAKGADYRTRIAPLRLELAELLQAAQERLNPTDGEGKPRKLSKEERAQQALVQREEDERVAQLRTLILELSADRQRFDDEISRIRTEAATARAEVGRAVRQLLEWERGKTVKAARDTLQRLESEAELERLRMVRDAILVSESLGYTGYRPTAWWFPMVSPDGTWFNQLVSRAKVRIEDL